MPPSYIVIAVALVFVGVISAEPAAQPTTVRANGAVQKVGEAPWFCHGLDCPQYTVEDTEFEKEDEIELRAYEAGVWMSTNVSDVKYEEATGVGFMRLFRYISGANADKAKIAMTAPVRTLLIPGDGPFCESHFKISFYVPPSAAPPPAATDPLVFVDESPPQRFYVASYSGWSAEKSVLDHAFATIGRLEAAGLAFDASVFYAAGYDSPFRLLNRHNEVWIPAAAAPETDAKAAVVDVAIESMAGP
ncbi:hypothetical protein FOA52_004012 [Chlamydomonas sp. UWO 241]|nr:hypothetical protein FOA52_004012 [Chlamydomonas sp. UWO 241]